MTYTPILLRLWRCLTQPDRPEPPPQQLPERFPQRVDYIVHTDPDGTRTELVRVHLDVAQHHICGTWPIAELDLVRDDCA